MKSPCKAQVLNYLVSRKEFRVIPVPIWRHVQSNADLSIEARFLWGVLWELCALEHNYEKRLTWSFLSKRVGKSESTVRRWSRSLQRAGYLEITNVFGADGNQLPSMFRIGVPNEIAENAAKSFPDRKKKEGADESGVRDSNPAQTIEVSSTEPSNEIAPNNSQTSDARTDHAESETVVELVPQTVEIPAQSAESTVGVLDSGANVPNPALHADFPTACTKIGGVNSVSSALSRLSKHFNPSGKGSNLAHTQRSEAQRSELATKSERFSYGLRTASAIGVNQEPKRAGEGASRSRFDRASTSATQDNNPAKQENNKNPGRGEGLRRVIQAQLEKRLPGYDDLGRLVEEFAVSIEKGAFKKFELAKALNIGVKLVREGRWLTPRYAG